MISAIRRRGDETVMRIGLASWPRNRGEAAARLQAYLKRERTTDCVRGTFVDGNRSPNWVVFSGQVPSVGDGSTTVGQQRGLSQEDRG